MQGVGWGRLTLTSFAPPPAPRLLHLSPGLRLPAERCSMLVVSQSPPAKEKSVSENLTTSNGITYKAERGAPGYGWFVTASRPLPSSYCTVVAGPYTNEAAAHARAVELHAELEAELGDDGLVVRGLEELRVRRSADGLGIDLGPHSAAEVAATDELARTAGELGVSA